MATLESLKRALRQKAATAAATATATTTTSSESKKKKQPLSDTQYSAGFDTLVMQGSGWLVYQDFIIPQLHQLLLDPLFFSNSRDNGISVLEIGPGPKSVLAYLPGRLRRQVRRYVAYEPNELFAARLEEWLSGKKEKNSSDERRSSGSLSPSPSPSPPPLGGLETTTTRPEVRRIPFPAPRDETTEKKGGAERYDVILFCHSMYGMKPEKRRVIERALEMLVERPPQGGMVLVFHRDGTLDLNGLVCHRTASFPAGIIRVANQDAVLDSFARFVAGFVMHDVDVDQRVRVEWRQVCRALGHCDEGEHPGHLLFSAPTVMVALTRYATTLPELTAQVPVADAGTTVVKNRAAGLHRAASILKPTEIRHLQLCVRWALKHRAGLTIVAGGHSGHCLWPHVVAIDMRGFDQVHILKTSEDGRAAGSDSDSDSLVVVADAGCSTEDIVRKTMEAGLTVPLGARPSVGAGLWLQGGIGHLARVHGLGCDAIIGAVVVSVESSQVLCVGCVPREHWPAGAVRPENESDLLWAIKGAGTNFGIMVSVTFKTYAAPTYLTRKWDFPLSDENDARLKLSDFDNLVARKLQRHCSADAYLYWDAGRLHLGVSVFESCAAGLNFQPTSSTPAGTIWGSENCSQVVDGVNLFESEMYVSEIHGGHGGGKTSSFKRCLFLNHVGEAAVADRLVAAIETRPSPLCYLHLLQGGGAVSDIAADATAFGCRGWAFACVITGVWPRDQDGTEAVQSAVRWVYDVSGDLLPFSSGAYSADLGPDPRDAPLAAKAFGSNQRRLARLKRIWDPCNVLSYACPILGPTMEQKLIVLVTGESCAGKDYCAEVWASVFAGYTDRTLTARVVSISDATKREYAAATGANLSRLLWDRAYKEQHRPALTRYFQEQVRRQARLPEQHFLSVVNSAVDVDVLLITGMRDEAPVAVLSHLLPDSRLIEVQVRVGEETRQIRRGCHGDEGHDNMNSDSGRANSTGLDYRPTMTFDNDTTGDEMARRFAQDHLLPLVHQDLQQLALLVDTVPEFPRPQIEFHHVLGISQHPGGLALCTSLLQTHFVGDWARVDAVACCEAGGFIYASALAMRVDVPLVLIREAGKLPPPTVSVIKSPSYVSSVPCDDSKVKRIEMQRDVVRRGASVVVVDDVLSTGETLCAVLQLLGEAGIDAKDVRVLAVVEFPVHQGRELLRQRGFGRVNIQSLLVFGGV